MSPLSLHRPVARAVAGALLAAGLWSGATSPTSAVERRTSDLAVTVTPSLSTPLAADTVLPSGVVAPAGQMVNDNSVSRTDQPTYQGYEVVVRNISQRTINHVKFRATSRIFTAPAIVPAPVATFFESQGITCVATLGGTQIDCEIGQMTKAGGATDERRFEVAFLAPQAGQQLDLDWKVWFSEGDADNEPQASRIDTVRGTGYTRLVTLTAPEVRTTLKSYVPTTGGRFFTGIGAVATATDPVTTTVIVPPGRSTTAQISEIEPIVVPCIIGSCFESRLTIPGTFDALTILLRRDNTTIPPGFKARDVVVFYIADAGPNAGVPIQLQKCAKRSPPGPAPHEPCIQAVRRYSKANAPTPEWVRDKEIEIKALDNGRYIN